MSQFRLLSTTKAASDWVVPFLITGATTASLTRASARRFASTSPSSMRYPLSLICSSMRPSKKRSHHETGPGRRFDKRAARDTRKNGGREIRAPKVAGANIWSRDNNFASLVCWQNFASSILTGRFQSRASRDPPAMPNIFPKSNGQLVRKSWLQLPRLGHTCSTLALVESAQANEPQFARASVSPQKRNRRTRGSIASANFFSTRHICANDGVETHVVTPEFPARDKAFSDSPSDRG